MFGDVVRGVPSARFEDEIARIKRERGVRLDTELDTDALRVLTERFKALYDFPTDPREQLEQAIHAVFDSWMGERAIAYRRINDIPDDWGTAVNVQQMVYGNKGPTSGSGVAFSRDEVTGAPEPSGDFLIDAQGEDVVSGVRNAARPVRAARLDARRARPAARHHAHAGAPLRRHAGHRVHDRGRAPVHAADAQREAPGAGGRPLRRRRRRRGPALEGSRRSRPSRRARCTRCCTPPSIPRPTTRSSPAASPLRRARPRAPSCSPRPTRSPRPRRSARSSSCGPSPRPTTSPGFHAAKGILTSEGGKASHAALVARGMGCPAVTGADALEIDLHAREVRIGERVLHEGDLIAIDGTAGTITLDDVALVTPEVDPRFDTLLEWCDELRTLGVRANADTPEDARRARAFGAEGVGLCRTEHMFMAADRQPKMQRMIMARRRGRPTRRAGSAPARCSRTTSSRSSRRWRGCPSPSGCSTRRCTSSCPTASSSSSRSPRRDCRERPRPARSSTPSSACARWPRATRCSARAACGWG